MSFGSYSTTPSLNVTIAGQSMAEGTTSVPSINNAIRQLMADGKSLFDTVSSINLSGYATLNAPAFTGQPTYSGRGALIHFNSSANASGRVYVQSAAAALPTLSNGDQVWTY